MTKEQKKKKQKKFQETKARLQAKMAESLKVDEEKYIAVDQEHDETYYEGVQWLDALAGPTIPDFGILKNDEKQTHKKKSIC